MPFRAINGYANELEVDFICPLPFLPTLGMTVYIGRIYSSLILQTDEWHLEELQKALAYHRNRSPQSILVGIFFLKRYVVNRC